MHVRANLSYSMKLQGYSLYNKFKFTKTLLDYKLRELEPFLMLSSNIGEFVHVLVVQVGGN